MLNMIDSKRKKKNKEELQDLLKKEENGKLTKEQEIRLKWVTQIFTPAELVEIVKQFCLASMQSKDKSKKNLTEMYNNKILSLNELPEQYNYINFNMHLKSSHISILSETISLESVSSNLSVEYKARTTGYDINLAISHM